MMYENYAVSGLVVNIFNSHIQSTIMSSTTQNNQNIPTSVLFDELHNQCQLLCSLKQEYKEYLRNHPQKYEVIASETVLKLIYGNILLDSMIINHEVQIIDSYLSEIQIKDVHFSQIIANVNVALRFSTSAVTVSNITISNISDLPIVGVPIFAGLANSNINLSNLTLTNSEASLLYLGNSNLKLKNVYCESVYIQSSLITSYISDRLEINGFTIKDFALIRSSLISLMNSNNILLSQISIHNIQATAIEVKRSHIKEAVQLSIVNSTKGLLLSDHSSAIITNSSFTQVGNEKTLNGGAIESRNSNVTIQTSTFTYNRAKAGGSVALL